MSASQPSRFAPSPSQSRPRTEFVFEPLLDSDEAAQLLRIHPKTLQRMARNRQIHGIQVGKLWRFRASDLEGWLKTKKSRLIHAIFQQTFCRPATPLALS